MVTPFGVTLNGVTGESDGIAAPRESVRLRGDRHQALICGPDRGTGAARPGREGPAETLLALTSPVREEFSGRGGVRAGEG